MHYNWQPFFISFLITSLFGNEQLVFGALIPFSVREHRSPETVEVSGLKFSREYISPNAANMRRQMPGTVAVPKNQLDSVLQQLQDMELMVLALINQNLIDGQLDSTDPSGVFVGSEGRVISISSPAPSSVNPDPPSSAAGSGVPAEPTGSAAESGSAAASSTTAPDSEAAASSAYPSEAAASSSYPTEPATPTPSDGGVFAQDSSAAEKAPAANLAPAQDSTTGYVFNAKSSKNVAVYFGQTPVTGGTTLAAQCADANIDIVILAFVISTSYEGGPYPQVNFGAACGGQTPEMVSKAPGLLSCPKLASDITTCQTTYGKKVFLSIGGAASQISFPTAASASTFATTMWNLFGPPGSVDIGLRPFGTAQLDGFDVDNEDNLPANWATFATTMRTHYASTKTKTYYLSSAPQCPFPDASNPQALLLLCDFVWVQFYNNPQCQIGSAGFTASLKQWSAALLTSTMTTKPRMYLGAPAFSAAGSTAYAAIGNAKGMESIASSVEKMGLSNFGGVMFWDGPEAMLNTAGGKDILGWTKAGLTS